MRKLEQKKYWVLGPVLIIALLLSARIIAQKIESTESSDESYKLSLVSESPVLPGCEGSEFEIRKCLSESLSEHFKNNFDSDLLRKLFVESDKKWVSVFFQIDNNGQFTSIKTFPDNEDVNLEVKRVFSSIPTLVPGIRKNEKVNVKYNIQMSLNEGQLEVKGTPTTY